MAKCNNKPSPNGGAMTKMGAPSQELVEHYSTPPLTCHRSEGKSDSVARQRRRRLTPERMPDNRGALGLDLGDAHRANAIAEGRAGDQAMVLQDPMNGGHRLVDALANLSEQSSSPTQRTATRDLAI
jgi:hypothetical protein